MSGSPFARAFTRAVSNREFTPEMKAKVMVPPRGLIHSWKGRHRGKFARCTMAGDARDTRRRVITKIHHMSGIRWRTKNTAKVHANYLCRTHRTGLELESEAFFDRSADGVDGRGFAAKVDYDDHHFRIVIAPFDGDKLAATEAGMKGYVREVMAGMEKDLQTKLEWVAVLHRKPDRSHEMNWHAHVLVRGVTDRNQALRMSSEYVHAGFQERCQRHATDTLGRMPAKEMEALRERAAERAARLEKTHQQAERAL